MARMSRATPHPRGLTVAEAARRARVHGPNSIARAGPPRWPRLIARQFANMLVLILVAAAAIAWAIGDRTDAIAIGVVVLLNATFGFAQEWRAETAIRALRGMLAPTARVIRDGVERRLPSAELVPGDLVLVEAGDSVPADLSLSDANTLLADESALTGESVPVEKAPGDTAFMGTLAVSGRGRGTVTAIGAATEFGRIAEITGSVRDTPANLQVELGRLGRQIGVGALLLAAAVAVFGIVSGRDTYEMLMTALSLAVAMVPEGLPAVVTVTLALGAAAMVRQRALTRRLQAVETLGAATVICADKTGTMTENRMVARRIWTPGADYEVTGGGPDPAGHIRAGGTKVRAGDAADLGLLLDTAVLCNTAGLRQDGDAWHLTGSPTEGALLVLAYKGWAPPRAEGEVLAETPFSSERKLMSVLARRGGVTRLHAKGAPERILSLSDRYMGPQGPRPLDAATRARIEVANRDLAAQGMRVIGMASREAEAGDHVEDRLVFLGLVGILDPPRPEVPGAILACRRAGIRVIMITGDGPVTATAIARDVGLPVEVTVTGDEVEAMDEATLDKVLRRQVLFARTAPAHKLRIVAALRAQGEIVAMTGDGVNDAPALKQADIGVAMGGRGTDVAREAADLVLLDDNFATIVAAIAEGRRQFENVRKFVRYLLASNAGEVIAIVPGILMGWPLIFFAPQILWINLVTDTISAVALGLEPAEAGQMDRRRGRQRVLDRNGLYLILAFGLYTGLASLGLFWVLMPEGEDIARSAAFTGLVVFELVAVLAFRSFRHPLPRLGLLSNPILLATLALGFLTQLAAVYWPPLQAILDTVPLDAGHWLRIALLALPLLVVPEIAKALRAPAT